MLAPVVCELACRSGLPLAYLVGSSSVAGSFDSAANLATPGSLVGPTIAVTVVGDGVEFFP